MINFVYLDDNKIGSPWFLKEGLRRAFYKMGVLNYSVNVHDKVEIDYKQLNKYPTLILRGNTDRMRPVSQRVKSYKVCFHTENNEEILNRQGEFDLILTFDDLTDGINNFYHLLSWADTEIFYKRDVKRDFLPSFVGNTRGREGHLDGVKCYRTEEKRNSLDNAEELSLEINKHFFHVSPKGRSFRGFCGRGFEVMACGMFCFVYRDGNAPVSYKAFIDGKHLAYYSSQEELLDKYTYYLNNPSISEKIAQSGMLEVRNNHNQDVRAKEIWQRCEYANL